MYRSLLRNLRIGSPPIKSRYRERRTRRKLNAEVAKQLPNECNREESRKIYDPFSNIGVDKI